MESAGKLRYYVPVHRPAFRQSFLLSYLPFLLWIYFWDGCEFPNEIDFYSAIAYFYREFKRSKGNCLNDQKGIVCCLVLCLPYFLRSLINRWLCADSL